MLILKKHYSGFNTVIFDKHIFMFGCIFTTIDELDEVCNNCDIEDIVRDNIRSNYEYNQHLIKDTGEDYSELYNLSIQDAGSFTTLEDKSVLEILKYYDVSTIRKGATYTLNRLEEKLK